jgi:WD40 repeat protein
VAATTPARIWEVATGRELMRLEGSGSIIRIVYSPDGQRILTGGYADHTLRLWDVNSGRQVFHAAYPGAVSAVAMSPDMRRIAVGGTGVKIRILDTLPSWSMTPADIDAWKRQRYKEWLAARP